MIIVFIRHPRDCSRGLGAWSQTVNQVYYKEVLTNLHERVRRRRPEIWKQRFGSERIKNWDRTEHTHYTYCTWLELLLSSFEPQCLVVLTDLYLKPLSVPLCCLCTGLLLWCSLLLLITALRWQCGGVQVLLRRCFQRQHTQVIPGTSINAAGMRNKSGSENVDMSEGLCSAKKQVKVSSSSRIPEYGSLHSP